VAFRERKITNRHEDNMTVGYSALRASSPVSIQTQSLALRALRALRKRKPQETQTLAFYFHATNASASQ